MMLQKTFNLLADRNIPRVSSACRTQIYYRIYRSAVPYLQTGQNKDFVIHTQGVMKAMGLILQEVDADPMIVIPAAILHDVGWAKVPDLITSSTNPLIKRIGLEQHIASAPDIIRDILWQVRFRKERVDDIVRVVKAHKFCDPTAEDERLLIDADNLSDIFSLQFYVDAMAYGVTAKQMLEYRGKNTFYFDISRSIFESEFRERQKEIAESN